jgi:hypothetical protein
MAISKANMDDNKTFVLGIPENSSKETAGKVGSRSVASPIGKVDLLDLLDEKFLPKDRVKNHGRSHISILDVMGSRESVMQRIAEAKKKEVEARKRKSMDLVNFLDKKTYLPKKNSDEMNAQTRKISVLDVMNPPPSYSYSPPKQPVDLVSLLDEKTRLPRDSRGESGRRRISLLEILGKTK